MLDTLNIRRYGFPQRLTAQDFVDWATILVKDPDHPNDVCLVPEDPAGSQQQRQETAVENAGRIAPYLQAAWAERIFDELASSDRNDPLFIKQKEQVVVVGCPRDGSVAPLIMMRDWFMTGVEKYREAILRRATAILQPAVQAGVHSQMLYGKLVRDAKKIQPMLRGLIDRVDYMNNKWNAVQITARSQLCAAVKAKISRAEYHAMRSQHFEGMNRQHIAVLIKAATERIRFRDTRHHHLVDGVVEQVVAVISQRKEAILCDAREVYAEAVQKVHDTRVLLDQLDRLQVGTESEGPDQAAPASIPPAGSKVVRYFPLIKRVGGQPSQPVVAPSTFAYTYNFVSKPIKQQEDE
eukprot:TRINITY_DN6928_c0_g1_i3.p1 TRINITY_DN6928_c0_g1~~TRINITY_DN6928_c0_g1_i3.p1  ORF type:complete len:352 (+),score=107.63 TRINITY_DN6928_c0_g1_i3:227-1282(+)